VTRRRDRTEIEAEILGIAGGVDGALKTQIVYRANLNFGIVEGYLTDLELAGLIARRGVRYLTTEAGEAYLVKLHEIRALRGAEEDPELRLLRRFHEPL